MSTQRNIVAYELEGVDWDAVRIVGGAPASAVPDALANLLAAGSDDDAEKAYWRLDNRVVVQGQLFDSAPKLVPALLAAAAGPVSEVALPYVLDLLVEIVTGESDETEVVRGNASLGREARRAARDGLWLAYRFAIDAEAVVRQRALFIVHAVDPDRDRVAQLFAAAEGDADSRVRDFAAELRDREAPEL